MLEVIAHLRHHSLGSTAGPGRHVLAEYALTRRVQARIGRGGLVLRSCAHPPLVSVAVKTYPRYERDEASLQNDGQSWEFFDA